MAFIIRKEIVKQCVLKESALRKFFPLLSDSKFTRFEDEHNCWLDF